MTQKTFEKYSDLRIMLEVAKDHACKVGDMNDEDGGTCNFDSPFIYADGYKEKDFANAVEEAGLRYFATKYCGSKVYVITGFMRGQANLRTRMAEAFCDALKMFNRDKAVISFGMWYQMD